MKKNKNKSEASSIKLDRSLDLGYTGIMTEITKAIDLTYLRGQVIALLRLNANIQKQINDLEEKIKKEEECSKNQKEKK